MRQDLEGTILQPSSPEEIRAALDKAFGYRGDVTITLTSGERLEGYIFDRKIRGSSLTQCMVRMMPRVGNEKISVRYSDIVRLEFTGRDAAAGKRFDLWLKNYHEKKATEKKSISLAVEPLE